jgi:2-haloacid dehalogenase
MAESLARLAADEGLPLEPGQEQALGDALPSWRPFAEVPAALAELRRRGWRLALLSNSDPDLLAASARQIAVEVDLRVSAAEARSYKPAHGHWLRFWELSGVTPGRHVHVAASLFHDIAPAAELGVPAVWINRPDDVTNRIDGRTTLACAAELTDLSPLPDTLDRLVAERPGV